MLIELFSLGVTAESLRAKRDEKPAISLQRCDKLTAAINLVWLDWPDSADWHLSSGRQTYRTCLVLFRYIYFVVSFI